MDNVKDQLSRMKGLMKYGLQTENKSPFASVEFSKKGADGKLYGIVREGTKYYIKECGSGKKGLVKEDYDYIGGFRNRKDYQYDSYANALKHFDIKLASLKEANLPKSDIITESWTFDNSHKISSESADRMKAEINRQREIMRNASLIGESKKKDCKQCGVGGNPFTINAEEYFKDLEKTEMEKRNIKEPKNEAPTAKDRKSKGGKATVKEGKMKGGVCPKCGKAECECDECGTFECSESADVLAWRRNGEPENDHYMDMSHGTEIGDSAPFDGSEDDDMKNGIVDEANHGKAMHQEFWNQNSPEVGTNSRNAATDVDEPFDEEINEAIEDTGDELDDVEGDATADDFGGEGGGMDDLGGEDEGMDDLGGEDEGMDDFGDEDTEYELETEDGDDELEDRLSAIEDTLDKIADKLDVDQFDDDELYDDEDGEDDMPEEEPEMPEGDDDDMSDDEPVQTFESRSYRKMKLREAENRLNVFGRHPAYRKKPMTVPPKDHREFDGYYDMNDETAKNDLPFGEKIGSGAPFEVDIDSIENAIAESISRMLKKK